MAKLEQCHIKLQQLEIEKQKYLAQTEGDQKEFQRIREMNAQLQSLVQLSEARYK